MIHRLISCAVVAQLGFSGQASAQVSTVPVRIQRVLDSLAALPQAPPVAAIVLSGNPGADTGRIEMLLRIVDGAWIPPHSHNVAKELEVLSGTLLMGHGATIDPAGAMTVAAGSRASVPADSVHYEGARGTTVVLLRAAAPFRTVRAP